MRSILKSQNLCYNLNAGNRNGVSLKKLGLHFGRNDKVSAKIKLHLSGIFFTQSTHCEACVELVRKAWFQESCSFLNKKSGDPKAADFGCAECEFQHDMPVLKHWQSHLEKTGGRRLGSKSHRPHGQGSKGRISWELAWFWNCATGCCTIRIQIYRTILVRIRRLSRCWFECFTVGSVAVEAIGMAER